ncbi:MAG: hypothetical protein E6J91_01170 [Deltaproteobacteria bacterium]|nr:MAG: hypothetical protein E6J91_01170 [Deltaproteobacteria bacterium]
MRTPFLAAALGLGLAGCLVGDARTPAAGGDDDGNGSQGSNGSNGSNNPTPKVDVTVDRTTVASELHTNNPINVTVTGSGGFAGDVALSGSIVDSTGTAIAGWAVDFNPATVTLSANGTGSSVATLKIPGLNTGLAGMLKITGASAATTGTNIATIPVNVTNQVTFSVKVDNATGKCVYTADSGTVGTPVKLSLGTKVRFFNTGTANLVIHSGGVISHQGQAPNGLADPVTEPNTAYEQMPTGTGAATWYCHDPATDLSANDPRFTVQ